MLNTFQKIRARLEELGTKAMTLSDEESAQIDQEIDELAASIAQEPTAEAAEPKLLQLAEVERVLCTICFSTDLPFSDKQRDVVRNYDRCELLEVRRQCFGWIKEGTFPVKSHS